MSAFLQQLFSASQECGSSSVNWFPNKALPICFTGSTCMASTINKKYVQNFFRMYWCENRTKQYKITVKGFLTSFLSYQIFKPPQALITWPVI